MNNMPTSPLSFCYTDFYIMYYLIDIDVERSLIMSKDITKLVMINYHSNVLPICKLLKSHATNIMLLPNNIILMQPSMNGIRNYMIANNSIDYSNFIYTYFSIPDISKVNTKFKKTKSEIEWSVDDGTNYLVIKNENMEPYKSPIINNPAAVADILNATYQNLPNWKSEELTDILCDEDNSLYNMLPESFIEDMNGKKLCELNINGHSILLSRPFLGDLKKTLSVGYRVLYEDDVKMILKFKQSEEIGNIYTIAAFLIV